MASSNSVSEFRSGLDDFLYASIDEGENGRLLSVLSMLARLNVDPWQEAANLARMPRENATQRLASLIAALPGGSSAHQDTNAVAIRLITLLPRDGSSHFASGEILPAIGVPCNLRAIVYVIVINLIFVAIAFGSHYLLVDTQSSARSEHAHVPVTGEDASKALPSIK